MSRVLVLLVSIFSNLEVCAQSEIIDSLKNELVTAKEDTSQVLILNTLAYQLHIPNPREGVTYARQSIELATQLEFDKGRAHAYNSLGAGYWNMSELDSALKYYTKSYQLNDTLGNARGVTGALSNIAIIYENRGQYSQAIEAYTNALEEMRVNGFDSYVAITSNNLGMVLRRVGEYSEALKYYRESIKIGEELDMTYLLGPTWVNIGNIYSDINDPTKELEAKEKALQIGIAADNKSVMALAFNNLGNFFKKRSEFNQAVDYYQRALEINTKVGKRRSIVSNLINIGEAKKELQEYDSSHYYLEQALVIADEIDYVGGKVKAYYHLGLATTEISNIDQAMPNFIKAYKLAVEVNSFIDIKRLSDVLYHSYLEKGNYERAFFFQNEYMKVKDSLINEENIKELAKLEAQYEFENQISAKENEISFLETKEEITELRILVGLITSLLVIGSIGFVATIMVRRRNRKNQELQATNQFKEAMTGMIAHDLKNPLSVIMNSKGEQSNKEMAGQMLHMVNNLLDVHRFEKAQVKLSKTNLGVTDLINQSMKQIQHLLIEKNLKVSAKISDAEIAADFDLMTRVLVNLLTNAIKYSPINSEIGVGGTIENDTLLLSVKDHGKGIPNDQIEKIFESFAQLDPRSAGGIGSTGLGLTFVKLAVEAHGFEIKVDSKVGIGTTFEIKAPITSKNEETSLTVASSISLSEEERKVISGKLTQLKKLNLYQIGEIEKELDELRERENVDDWADAVLSAAYAGNKDRYHELLSGV